MKISLLFFLFFPAFTHNVFAQNSHTFKEFYPSGKLKLIGHQGFFEGCGMFVGTDTVFYESGKIKSTTFYDNRKSKNEIGCHATWTIEVSKTFYQNGKLKLKFQNKSAYEGAACNCGNWIWYDKNGKVIRQKYFGDCYDQIPCAK